MYICHTFRGFIFFYILSYKINKLNINGFCRSMLTTLELIAKTIYYLIKLLP